MSIIFDYNHWVLFDVLAILCPSFHATLPANTVNMLWNEAFCQILQRRLDFLQFRERNNLQNYDANIEQWGYCFNEFYLYQLHLVIGCNFILFGLFLKRNTINYMNWFTPRELMAIDFVCIPTLNKLTLKKINNYTICFVFLVWFSFVRIIKQNYHRKLLKVYEGRLEMRKYKTYLLFS